MFRVATRILACGIERMAVLITDRTQEEARGVCVHVHVWGEGLREKGK